MPELRQDPVSGRWVIIAGNRAGRPEEFHRTPMKRIDVECPFCRGHEHLTAPPLAWYGPDHTAPERWEVRVVPNKYPALTTDARESAAEEAAEPSGDELFAVFPGLGRHEVVIESPRHVESFSQLSDDQAYWTFCAYRDRLRVHADDPALAAATAFKNVGPEGGASLVHAHSQILSVPQVPDFLALELAGALKYQSRHGQCVFCTMLNRELEAGVRIVAEAKGFVAFCPFAAGFAYETWIFPRQHSPRFELASDADLRDAALLLKRVISGLERILDHPAYNYFLHTSPFDTPRCDHYHWHMELFPRVSKAAGFEWCSGWRMNSVPPERAAEKLRAAIETA